MPEGGGGGVARRVSCELMSLQTSLRELTMIILRQQRELPSAADSLLPAWLCQSQQLHFIILVEAEEQPSPIV